MGKNNKPMLTVLMDSAKLQHLRDYASANGMSMGAIVNQLVDNLLAGEPKQPPLEQDKSVHTMVSDYIDNNNKSIDSKIATYIDTNNKALEEFVTASIDSRLATLSPTLSLIDVDRQIGSAMVPLQSAITKQGAEIERLSNLVAANTQSLAETSPQPLASPLAWGGFCAMIGEPLPKDRTKASADKMVALALGKGFGEWMYSGKTKKFCRKSE